MSIFERVFTIESKKNDFGNSKRKNETASFHEVE